MGLSRARRLLVGALVLLAACADEPRSADAPAATTTPVPESTAAPTVPTTAEPAPTTQPTTTSTTFAPETTVVVTSTSAPPPTTDRVPMGSCALGSPDPQGEVAFVQDGRLMSVDSEGHVRCLVDRIGNQEVAAWSGTGERLLTTDHTIVEADSSRPSGIAGDALDASWSQPTGKALIAIDPATDHLIWHSSGSDETIDVSFLERTDEAVYHPEGNAIAAIGMAEDGTYGVWIASNRGADRHLITRIDDPSTPATDLAFGGDGTALFFVHRAVHELILDGLILNELGIEGRSEHNLVASTIDDSWAVDTGPCDRTGSVVGNGLDVRTETGSPFAGHAQVLQAVGWLGGIRLVLAARPHGCDGPADIWLWSYITHEFTQIGTGWDGVSVRAPHGPFVDLPDQIDEAAPG